SVPRFAAATPSRTAITHAAPITANVAASIADNNANGRPVPGSAVDRLTNTSVGNPIQYVSRLSPATTPSPKNRTRCNTAPRAMSRKTGTRVLKMAFTKIKGPGASWKKNAGARIRSTSATPHDQRVCGLSPGAGQWLLSINPMRAKAKTSQQKIAKSLGVSQALVSLALNGRRESINPETYKRIWDYAVSQGYTPKGMNFDQALAGARPRQVGFILRAPLKLYNASNFFSHVQHGLHMALESQGYTSTFLGSEETLTDQKLAQFVRSSNGCRGVVLLGQVSREFLQSLRRHTENIVAVSACYPGLCHSVQSNEQQALDQLVEHLTSLGHERIGWLGGNRGMIRHDQRFSAFKQALADRKLPLLEDCWSVQKEADRVEGAQAIRELLPQLKKTGFPTAFITYNGMMARGAIN